MKFIDVFKYLKMPYMVDYGGIKAEVNSEEADSTAFTVFGNVEVHQQ